MCKLFDSIPEFGRKSDYPAYDCNDGTWMKLFENVTAEEFNQYIDVLMASGLTVWDKYSLGDNFYYAFECKAYMLYLCFSEHEGKLRIIADPNMTKYSREEQTCVHSSDTILYQFEVDHRLIDCGMCYIIQCADNSFFIIDSAHIYSVNDNERIYNFLRERTPEGQKIVIAGWFFSHGHVDHIGKFMDFLKYNTADVTIEGLYYNFVSCEHPDNVSWSESDKAFEINFEKLVAGYDIPKIKLHRGARFWVRNLKFEVLCAHEDVYPNSLENYNDSSTVLMMTANGSKVLFPGDAGDEESKIMVASYGKLLKSDIVQVAHHGHFGTSVEFYELVNAQVALFATTQIKYDEEFVVYEANRKAVDLCSECYIASNGTVEIKLPYVHGNTKIYPDETFEDFEGIYNLWGYEYTDERKDELRKAFEAAHRR